MKTTSKTPAAQRLPKSSGAFSSRQSNNPANPGSDKVSHQSQKSQFMTRIFKQQTQTQRRKRTMRNTTLLSLALVTVIVFFCSVEIVVA